jgi:hypothetical protein
MKLPLIIYFLLVVEDEDVDVDGRDESRRRQGDHLVVRWSDITKDKDDSDVSLLARDLLLHLHP